MSPLSRNHRFHCTRFCIVPEKFSQVLHVQLAAVMPALCMSSKTSRPHFEMMRPSKTMAAS